MLVFRVEVPGAHTIRRCMSSLNKILTSRRDGAAQGRLSLQRGGRGGEDWGGGAREQGIFA